MKALLSIMLLLPSIAFADVSVPRAKQYAYALYDTSVLGGATVVGGVNVINLGVQLPGGIVITDVFVYINTQFAAVGTDSIALGCVGAQDLMSYTSIKNLPSDRMLYGGVAGNTFNGAAAPIPVNPTSLNFAQGFGSVPSSSLPNGCPVSVSIQGQGAPGNFTPYTAGKFTAVIEYFKL